MSTRLVPFAGLFAGLKLVGLRHAKSPRRASQKNDPARIQHGLPNPPSSLQRFLPGHIMIEIPYSDVIKDILIKARPCKTRQSELGGLWESEFGFVRGNLFAGLSAGHVAKLSPASFSPAKSPAKETEACVLAPLDTWLGALRVFSWRPVEGVPGLFVWAARALRLRLIGLLLATSGNRIYLNLTKS